MGRTGSDRSNDDDGVIVPLYAPRPQQAVLHAALKRFNIIVAHRRFGKTVFAINEMLMQAVKSSLPQPRYAYVAPLLTQAKDVAWEYMKHYARPIPGTVIHETELRIDLANGARLRLYGADNPDRLRGLYLDGAVLDEAALMHPRVWPEIVRPALADRKGWAVFIGTPMGRNHFSALYDWAGQQEDWYRVRLAAAETGVLPPEELAAAQAAMDQDQYAQEFDSSFDAAIQGAFYGFHVGEAERDGRVGQVPYDPKLLVHTAWDLGIDDATVIWFFQRLGPELRIIDYYENSGEGLPHYVDQLQRRGYLYGEHFFPPDVAVRELGTGQSRIETLASLGVKPRVVKRLSLEDGIHAVRMTLPRCWFDVGKCARGLMALKQYRKEYDSRMKLFKSRPLHDWTSHAADAFRYLAAGLRETGGDGVSGPAKPRAETDYDPYQW